MNTKRIKLRSSWVGLIAALSVMLIAGVLPALVSSASADGVTVIEPPVPPGIKDDPCNPVDAPSTSNATWDVPADTDAFDYQASADGRQLQVTTLQPDTTFAEGTTHDYGLAPDSNVACPTPPPPGPTFKAYPVPAMPAVLPKTRTQVYQRCLDMRIVQHKGANTRRGPDVDTVPWFEQSWSLGNVVELDLQNSADSQPMAFTYHDSHLGAGTRNGAGVLSARRSAYIETRLTNHGDHIGRYRWVLRYLASLPRWKKAQLEFKPYYGQWTAGLVRWAYDQQVAHGVEGRIADSSNSLSVLRVLEAYFPGIYTQAIGFYDQQPNLATINRYGIDQTNVTYKAAFRPYGQFATYAAAAHAKRVLLSVRSNPSGSGDSAYWWTREIKAGATALVVQGHSKQYVCNAVR